MDKDDIDKAINVAEQPMQLQSYSFVLQNDQRRFPVVIALPPGLALSHSEAYAIIANLVQIVTKMAEQKPLMSLAGPGGPIPIPRPNKN